MKLTAASLRALQLLDEHAPEAIRVSTAHGAHSLYIESMTADALRRRGLVNIRYDRATGWVTLSDDGHAALQRACPF